MKIGLLVLVLALALGGCTSSPEAPTLETALTWEAPNAERVNCNELLAEWSDGQQGSPQACWRYLSAVDAAPPFRIQLASFADHIGAKPLGEAKCNRGGDRAITCIAVWKTADEYLWLTTGLNIEDLRRAMSSPEADDLIHELLVYTSETDPRVGDYLDTDPLD